jgi:hypothetical protein
MKKIPSHLQGLAIRNQKGKKETVEYKVRLWPQSTSFL